MEQSLQPPPAVKYSPGQTNQPHFHQRLKDLKLQLLQPPADRVEQVKKKRGAENERAGEGAPDERTQRSRKKK